MMKVKPWKVIYRLNSSSLTRVLMSSLCCNSSTFALIGSRCQRVALESGMSDVMEAQ